MDTNGGGKLGQIYLSEEKRVVFISATDVVIKKIHNMTHQQPSEEWVKVSFHVKESDLKKIVDGFPTDVSVDELCWFKSETLQSNTSHSQAIRERVTKAIASQRPSEVAYSHADEEDRRGMDDINKRLDNILALLNE